MQYGQYESSDPRLLDYSLSPLTRQQANTQMPSYQAPSDGGVWGTAGEASDVAGDVALASPHPYAKLAGLGLKFAGLGLGAYGKYADRDEAERRHAEAMREWREQKRIEREDREREIARQERQEGYFGSDFSQGFILLFNLSDENSIIQTKELFKIIDNTRLEIETELVPILIIGNKFHGKENFEQDFIDKTFEINELRELGVKVKYVPINILKEDEKVMKAMRWLIRKIV